MVPSQTLARFLVSRGFAAKRLHVIPSRIDVRRTEPGAAHRPLRVATAARLETHKGIDVLLDACARLGTGASISTSTVTAHCAPSSSARAAGLSLDVTFHGTVTDVRERLLAADVFVLPSRGENLPITILEAMAAALPVVASRVGGIGELVDEGVTGLLVEPDDAGGLAGALAALVDDPQRRAAMGRAGAARVRERFDAADAGPEMVGLYETLCASST